jgi:TonB-linked SusC/RagA family outer membrane protein
MRALKLTAAVLLFASLQVNAIGWTQTVTISENNVPVQKIFKEIFRQTGVSIVYNEELFDHFSRVSIHVKDVPIQKVLDECLKDQPFTYTMEDNTISITRKAEEQGTPAPEPLHDVRGHVSDSLGNPLARASVTIKGTHRGASTDAKGDFELKDVGENVTLVISYTGYATQEVRIKSGNLVNIRLLQETLAMDQFVVTALGIERQAKSLGYSTQRVQGKEFEDTKDLNIVNSMVGKVAGLEVNGSTEMFVPSDIRLRGVNPLIVVDGSPINATTWDLNYNDIESVDVLKGSTAASLYGSAGINGAIVITLKKGKSNRTTVEFTTTNMVEANLLSSPKVQTEYGSGAAGQYQYVNGSGTAQEGGGFTWGPRLDGRPIIQWDSPLDPTTGQRIPIPWIDHSGGKGNLVKFLENGFMTANNLNFESGNDRGSYRISLTQEYQKGIVPNTKINIYGFSVGGKYKFSNSFEMNTSLNYSKQYSPNFRVPAYGSNDYIYSLSFWLGNDIDLNDARNYWAPGAIGTQQRFAQTGYYNNPYFLSYQNLNIYDKDVVYGQVSGTVTFIPNELSLKARVGANSNFLDQQQEIPVGMTGTPLGNYMITDTRNFTIDNDAILSYHKKVSGNFSVDAIGGLSYFYTKQAINAMSTNGLVIPLFYSMSNSLNPGTIKNTLSESQTMSAYANVDLKFWKPLYLTLTGRNDWVSTLPVINNSYFYPSASLALVISDWLRMPSAISFLKVRSSVAEVNSGNTGSTYGQVQTYPVGVYNNMPTMTVSRSLIPANLLPSASKAYEFGGNIAFFLNRLSIDATYFSRLDYNNIISQSVSEASGFTSVTANGRKYETRGLELVVNATPIKMNDFRWDISVNYYSGHKYLKALEHGLTQDGYIKLGSRVDQIYMYPWLKDPQGNLILSAGLPQIDQFNRYTGNYDPDFMYGIQNHIKYKNFTLSFSLDGRKGGMYFSILPRMVRAGTSPDYDPKARADAANGLTNYVGKGVVVVSGSATYDGLGNITSDTRKFAPNTTVTNYESWEKTIGNISGNRAESYLHADYCKLREVSLAWEIPRKVFGGAKIGSGQFSIFGNNLILFTRKSSLGDDPSWLIGEGTNNSNLKSPVARSFGFQLTLKF